MIELEEKHKAKHFRDATKEPECYQAMANYCQKFCDDVRLKQSNHPFDSQKNEALNRLCTSLCPKDVVYSYTGSLQFRIAMAIGMDSLGLRLYFSQLLSDCGIEMSGPLLELLVRLDNKNQYDSEFRRNPKQKNARNKKKWDKWILEREANRQSEADGTTYKSCMAVSVPDRDGLDNEGGEDAAEPPAKKQRRDYRKDICPHCGLLGHTTTRSKNCKKREVIDEQVV